jgi:glycine/D-amino acid oxidase-like deaminating enzyme
MAEAAGKGDIFVTATGNRDVLCEEHFSAMRDGAVLANAGQLDEGLWALAGFAGHGVMHGPVLAELLARVMLGDPDPQLDLSACDPRRVSRTEHSGEWMIPHRQD